MERSPSSVWGHGLQGRRHTHYDTVSQALAHHYPDGLNTTECDSWLGMWCWGIMQTHYSGKFPPKYVETMFEHLTSMLLHFSDIITINSFRPPPSKRVITSRHAESSSHCEMPQTRRCLLHVWTWERQGERTKNISKKPNLCSFYQISFKNVW